MKTSSYNYDLPEKLIAPYPPERRGTTRLMIVNRDSNDFLDKKYADVAKYIKEGDIVVLNKTKVVNVRTYPLVQRTGRKVEVLFLNNIQYKQATSGNEYWYALIGRARHVKLGDILEYPDGKSLSVIDRNPGETGFIIELEAGCGKEIFMKYGHVPLPPYMKRKDEPQDEVRYNTIFAEIDGSVAAPTASLNLTEDILEEIREKGVKIVYLNLEIGWGTFAPVKTDKVEDFKIHSENYEITVETADEINEVIESGGDIWAFGTTVTRALESSTEEIATGDFRVKAGKKSTNLFIYPGYAWKIVDHLITNFHAPKSSLIMLVSAFAGEELIKDAYERAIDLEYSFLSYGDSMLIL